MSDAQLRLRQFRWLELRLLLQQRVDVRQGQNHGTPNFSKFLTREKPHGQRQGAEQDLIKAIEKYLSGS